MVNAKIVGAVLLLQIVMLTAVCNARAANTVDIPGVASDSAESREIDLPQFKSARQQTGVAVHDISDDRSLQKAFEVGFSFVRTDLFWEEVQEGTRFDFGKFNGLMHRLESRHMGALLILGYKHHEFSPAAPNTPSELSAFSDYVRHAVINFKGRNVKYELWNEPNIEEGWLGKPSPSEYGALAKATLNAAKSAYPEVILSTGGLSTVDWPYLRRLNESIDLNEFAAISVHPYRQSMPESVFKDYDFLRTQLQYANIDRPQLWDSEWGYPSFGYDFVKQWSDGHSAEARSAQAAYAVRRLLADWIAGTNLTVWYELRDYTDNGHSRESNFGLLDRNGNPKSAFFAVQQLMSHTKDAVNVKLRIGPGEQFFVLKLESPESISYVVWSCQAEAEVDVNLFSPLAVHRMKISDMYGNEIPLGESEKRLIYLRPNDGPIYITYFNPQ